MGGIDHLAKKNQNSFHQTIYEHKAGIRDREGISTQKPHLNISVHSVRARGLRQSAILTLVIIMASAIFSCGCLNGSAPVTSADGNSNHSAPLSVAVTIPPYREFAEAVGGDRVEAMVMVPPGASPHTYEPSPGQLRALSQTSLYLAVGTGIEFENAWMETLTSVNRDMQVVDTSAGITLLSTGTGDITADDIIRYDPHVWLSPANARIIARNIADAYILYAPDDAAYFEAQFAAYDAKLASLDEEIHDTFTGTAKKTVLVYHPAWEYYADRYGLAMTSVEEDGKEPSPASLKAIITSAEEAGIPVIFASPESPTRNAEAIADEIGGSVVYISPLAENYTENLVEVTNAFRTWAV
jgi:zinc transport system substrate-binding protein